MQPQNKVIYGFLLCKERLEHSIKDTAYSIHKEVSMAVFTGF